MYHCINIKSHSPKINKWMKLLTLHQDNTRPQIYCPEIIYTYMEHVYICLHNAEICNYI